MKEIERIKRNGSPSLPINSGKIPSEKKSSYLRRREEEKRQACVYAHAICTERKRERKHGAEFRATFAPPPANIRNF